MGKNRQKKRNSHLNSSTFSNDDSENSSCDCFVPSSSCLSENILPDKFLVSSVEKAKCGTYAKSLLKPAWKDIVFLHPHVMRKYEISDLVLIKGEEKTVLCDAYPVEILQKNLIVFPQDEYLFQNDELVSLQKFDSDIKVAEEIIIKFTEGNVVLNEDLKLNFLRLLSDRYIYENIKIYPPFFGKEYRFTITAVNNANYLLNSSKSNLNQAIPEFFKVSLKTSLNIEEKVSKTSVNEVGGLQKQAKLIKDHLQRFFNRSLYCGILLLEGPSGTGKSLLLQAILNEYNIFLCNISWWQLCSVSQSEIKQVLRDTFQRAMKNAPSVIVIEDFHNLCPGKSNAENLHLYISECISQFLKTLNDAKVLVIITAIEGEYDASVLQQCARLMDVIKFQIPRRDERADILEKILASIDHDLTFNQLLKCAEFAHGFNGKELSEAVKYAQIIATRRKDSNTFNSTDPLNKIKIEAHGIGRITYNDLHLCIKLKKKSIVAANNIQVKKVQWIDIGGMTVVKEKLKQIVEWPLKHPDAFKKFNITPSRGILLYGPPGCSKTMIAKALATECELNFVSKNAADLYDKYVGESEKAVRDLFAMAKAKSPCIIFLDEIDALVTERESSSSSSGVENRIVTTLLTEMDGVEELHGVIIIAATNRPDKLDDALVRQGRINHFIYIPLPDTDTREEILKISMRNRSVSENFDYKYLAEKTDGYSGAEIVNLCNEAAFHCLSEFIKDPNTKQVFIMEHFEYVLRTVHPRTNKEMIAFYEDFNKKHS